MAVQPIPAGQDAAIPYICVNDGNAAMAFYKQAFGAKELCRIGMPGGAIGHAELSIGNARIMLADEFPDMGFLGPKTIGGSPVTIHVYVPDVDNFIKTALAAGLKELRPLEDHFHGDRGGKYEDPFGHLWFFSTHIEDVSPEEIERRAAAMFGGG
jgi:PhnB protein